MIPDNYHFHFKIADEEINMQVKHNGSKWDLTTASSSGRKETEEKIKAAVGNLLESAELSPDMIKAALSPLNVKFIEDDKTTTVALNALAKEPDLVRGIENLIKEKMAIGFTGTVCVVVKGKEILKKGYGGATETAKNGAETTFRLASLTKPLTAAAILRLHDQQKIDINKPICDFLPKIKEKIDNLEDENQKKWLSEITIVHLMNHTSGLQSYPKKLYEASEYHTIEDVIDECLKQNPPVQFKPGSKSEYCNTGYVLLAKIIEMATEKPYEKAMLDLVFDELKMTNTRCPSRQEDDTPEAEGLTRDNKPITPAHASTRIGTGNAISNASDLAKFVQALNAKGFLSEESLKVMEKNGGWTLSGSAAKKEILVTKEEDKECKWVLKDGDMHGCHTAIAHLPDLQASVIILGNRELDKDDRWFNGGSVMGVCMDVAALIFKNKT